MEPTSPCSAQIRIDEEEIDDGLAKAMQGYQGFLEQTADTILTPEALRRLADLKIEREYGTLTAASIDREEAQDLPDRSGGGAVTNDIQNRGPTVSPARNRSEETLEIETERNGKGPERADGDLERTGVREAIQLYKKLLNDYPLYYQTDHVLYQMSRAYEELGETKDAMATMGRIVKSFPRSRYIDEVQFRRAEHFFAHRRYLDAEEAHGSVIGIGVGLLFYELAMYKLGWTYYKQELYQDALRCFITLMDHKVSVGYDFAQTGDKPERKRIEDTFRVISLGFSNLGGPGV